MKFDKYRDDPLDSLLDSESEDAFGAPEIRDRFDHGANESVNGNLKDWTAQDFASIYVRFRPHLERHAKRYLSNPVQAEEVVQDAFLYLMTTLPEMDSELGVLKFLKWKIRLLSFDILRSASSNREVSFPEQIDYSTDDHDFTADLERAEDNAVIRMALARLNPRQREALVASVYEEKTSEELATQLGLSSNATRQLLFRARSAFRKALVGEAEIQGKSISQVLTIATKKAALDARENATKVGAFLVLVSVGIGILPSLAPSTESMVAEAPEFGPTPQIEQAAPAEEYSAPIGSPENGADVESVEQAIPETVTPAEGVYEELATLPTDPQIDEPVIATTAEQIFSDQTLATILATNVSDAGFYTDSYLSFFSDLFQGVSVEVFGGTGISAFLDLNLETQLVRQIVFQLSVGGESYFAVATSTEMETLDNGDGSTIAIVSKEFYVVDERGNVFSESPLADSKAVVTLDLAGDGTPQSAALKVETSN